MRKIYLISDMHFGHSNIIKYENRPFVTVEEMDRTIIENWNAVVNKDDLVFVLGDVSFYNKEKTIQIVYNLIGRKTLILGNHDKSRSLMFWKEVGFEEVYRYPIIYDNFYILSHEPVYLNPNMPYINIHGHLHGTKLLSANNELQQFINVSVECVNYTPVNFNTVKNAILNKVEEI